MVQGLKNAPANGGATGVIPASVRSPGEGNVDAPKYSRLGNHMDRGA